MTVHLSPSTSPAVENGGKRAETGMMLVAAMMVMVLMSALGAALILVASSETMIAANFRNSQEALYAADAAADQALAEVAAVADWDQLLNGTIRSTFADGSPSGARVVNGASMDLSQFVTLASCRKTTTCSGAEMDAVTPERPWGANNPRWQLYAYGGVKNAVPNATVDSPYYVVVLVGDDPSETDNDPSVDGGGPNNPGAGVLLLRAQAFGPRSVHKTIEMAIARTGGGRVRLLSWREIR
jgi:type II secretory pathway pseudopilin PulG